MFMVLSSWRGHCESSPGSFDECRLSERQVATDPQTKPTDLAREFAGRLLPSTFTIAIYYCYSVRQLILIFRTEGIRLCRPRHCGISMCSSCPKLYIDAVVVVIPRWDAIQAPFTPQ